MSGNKHLMNFLTFAVLALNSIVLVSSSGSKITALNDYDDLYEGRHFVELRFGGGQFLKVQQDLEKLKQKESTMAPFLDEMFDEIYYIKYYLKEYKDNLEKVAVLFYVKVLAMYYVLLVNKLKSTLMGGEFPVYQIQLVFEKIPILEKFLFFYSSNPLFTNFIEKIKPLYLKKKIDGVDDREKQATVDALEKALQVVFPRWYQEAAETAGSSSEGPSNQSNNEAYDNSLGVINNFISSILPGSIMPPIPEVTINTALLDEKVEEFKLIIPEAVMEGGGSRVNKIIQVLMETQGLDVIEKKKDN